MGIGYTEAVIRKRVMKAKRVKRNKEKDDRAKPRKFKHMLPRRSNAPLAVKGR